MSRYAGATGSFALDLAKFAQQAQEAIDETLQEVVIEVGNSVIRMSPVDEGRFKGNWQFSIGQPAAGVLDTVDPDGTETSARLVEGALLFKAGETAYIVNNLPYGIPLEYGHSDQAPGGFVRITLARFQAIVEEAIRNSQV